MDGVEVAGSLLLTVFLVYIYTRQNRILERQEEILESQQEVQEAAEVEPKIHVHNWTINDGELKFNIKNTGMGAAYDLYVVTQIEIDDVVLGEVNQICKSKVDYYIPSTEDKTYLHELHFSAESESKTDQFRHLVRRIRSLFTTSDTQLQIRDRVNKESKIFAELSTELVAKKRESSPSASLDVDISISLVYYDSVGNEGKKALINDSVTLNTISVLNRSRGDSILTIDTLYLKFRINKFDVFGTEELIGPAIDSLCIEIENKGDVLGKITQVSTVVRIWTDNGFKSVSEFSNEEKSQLEFSGTDLSMDGSIGSGLESEFFVLARFKIGDEDNVEF